MEDAATAEISRTQIWQWVHHEAALDDGRPITADLVRALEDEELAKLRQAYGEEIWSRARFADARTVFDEVALADVFVPFLTIPAYRFLD
jgi:malate synthase